MDLNYAMSHYRITTLELEQAAIRAERVRLAAEHADMIVRRDGALRRVLRRLQARRAEATTVGAAEAPVAPAVSEAIVAEAAASAPMAETLAVAEAAEPAVAEADVVGESAPIAELVPAAPGENEARAAELVGCGTHAA